MRFGKKLPNETQTSHFQKGKPENHPLGDTWVVGCFILLLAAAYITGGTGNILENYGVTDIGDVSVLAIESWTWIGHYQHSGCNFMECQVKMCIKKTLNIDIYIYMYTYIYIYIFIYQNLIQDFAVGATVCYGCRRCCYPPSFWFHQFAMTIRLPTENTPGRHHTACRGIGNQLLVMGGGRRPSDKAWTCNAFNLQYLPMLKGILPLKINEYSLKRDYFRYPYHVYVWCIYPHLVVFL